MRKTILLISCILIAASEITGGSSAQRERFINVQGTDLKSRMEAAVRQGRSSPSPFWVAYAFDVRPGVAVDMEWRNFRGSTTTFSDTSVSFGRASGTQAETRNLGVFLLYERGGNALSRVQVYNLDRPRDYSGYPVYWLGRAGSQESLAFLQGLAESDQTHKVAENATLAIGLHDDARAAGILKDLIGGPRTAKVRHAAIFWLGQIGGETAFLASLAQNEQESTEARKQAVFAIGVSKDGTALSTIQGLYGSITHPEVKKQAIFAASINENEDDAVTFLIQVAQNDSSREMKKQAIFWLGQKASKRAAEALGDTVNSNDADTEVQKQAVFAISQRKKDEAVPLLIKIARTHPKGEVRKQAIFWLGQVDDERALEFFKEILAK